MIFRIAGNLLNKDPNAGGWGEGSRLEGQDGCWARIWSMRATIRAPGLPSLFLHLHPLVYPSTPLSSISHLRYYDYNNK